MKQELDKALAEAEALRIAKDAVDARIAMLAAEVERQKHMVKVKNEKIDELTNQNQEVRKESIVAKHGGVTTGALGSGEPAPN